MENKKINLKLIREKRLEKGFSLQEMADKMGMSNASNYLKYENGQYEIKASMLPQLSKILGVGITKFFA